MGCMPRSAVAIIAALVAFAGGAYWQSTNNEANSTAVFEREAKQIDFRQCERGALRNAFEIIERNDETIAFQELIADLFPIADCEKTILDNANDGKLVPLDTTTARQFVRLVSGGSRPTVEGGKITGFEPFPHNKQFDGFTVDF